LDAPFPSALRPLRKNVQVVFQDPYNSLDPRFTVRGILREALTAQVSYKKLSKSAQEVRMIEILEAVGLREDALVRFPTNSAGVSASASLLPVLY